MDKKRGSITVEAAVVLPFYILLLTFLANFLNIYYTHQVIQHGLNSAGSTLAQYCYAIDLTLGMDKLTLQEETSAKAQELGEAVNQFYTTAGNTLSSFNDGISLDTLLKELSYSSTIISAIHRYICSLASSYGSISINSSLVNTFNACAE